MLIADPCFVVSLVDVAVEAVLHRLDGHRRRLGAGKCQHSWRRVINADARFRPGSFDRIKHTDRRIVDDRTSTIAAADAHS